LYFLRAEFINDLDHVKENVAVLLILTNLNFLRNKIATYLNSKYKRTIREI
jgi:ribosomal protein S17E